MQNYTDGNWYSSSPIGINTITTTVGNLCKKAGFVGHYTNHSLRATAASRLYSAGVDEQLIAETTGHSSNAIRRYKRTSIDQKKIISDHISLEVSPNINKKLKSEDNGEKKISLNLNFNF